MSSGGFRYNISRVGRRVGSNLINFAGGSAQRLVLFGLGVLMLPLTINAYLDYPWQYLQLDYVQFEYGATELQVNFIHNLPNKLSLVGHALIPLIDQGIPYAWSAFAASPVAIGVVCSLAAVYLIGSFIYKTYNAYEPNVSEVLARDLAAKSLTPEHQQSLDAQRSTAGTVNPSSLLTQPSVDPSVRARSTTALSHGLTGSDTAAAITTTEGLVDASLAASRTSPSSAISI